MPVVLKVDFSQNVKVQFISVHPCEAVIRLLQQHAEFQNGKGNNFEWSMTFYPGIVPQRYLSKKTVWKSLIALTALIPPELGIALHLYLGATL